MKWISVKDRLPPITSHHKHGNFSDTVIIHEKWNDTPFIGYLREGAGWCVDTINFDTSGDAVVIDNINTNEIDYWMEIPEIPKEEVK